MKNILWHKLILANIVTAALLFGCSEHNPIESENEFDRDATTSKLMEQLKDNMDDADYLQCVNEYSEERCENFFEKYGSFDSPEIANPYYDDEGEYNFVPSSSDGKGASSSSDGKVESSSSETASDSTQSSESQGSDSVATLNYLVTNGSLYITLESYKQLMDTIDVQDPESDPTIRFSIESFTDGVSSGVKYTPFLLNKKDTRSWEGHSSGNIEINKGTDKIVICAIVMDQSDDDEDADISSGKCETLADIGFFENGKSETVKDDSSSVYEASWKWELYKTVKKE